MQATCEICVALNDAAREDRKLCNTPLKESEHFIILPCLGPLVKGHVLISSKKHYMNLFSMPEGCMDDFNSLVRFSIDRLGSIILFAEHGSFDEQMGGSCVTHTHVHVIPKMDDCYNVLDGTLKILKSDLQIMKFSHDTTI